MSKRLFAVENHFDMKNNRSRLDRHYLFRFIWYQSNSINSKRQSDLIVPVNTKQSVTFEVLLVINLLKTMKHGIKNLV